MKCLPTTWSTVEEYKIARDLWTAEVRNTLTKFKNHEAINFFFDIQTKDTYNQKTEWFIEGFRNETEGIGKKKAIQLMISIVFDENYRRTTCKITRATSGKSTFSGRYIHGQDFAIIYMCTDGIYLKFFPVRRKNEIFFRVVIHSEKENELYNEYGDCFMV